MTEEKFERDAKQEEIAARIEEALQRVDSLDEDRILRHFVNAVQSAIRTDFYQTDKQGQAKPLIAVKFESGKLTGPAAAAPALRDFRLFAARRRRAPALWQGGARRHPLVRPAAGFPHRDPRPGQGAAGQERGDRAGRRQGRLCAQAHSQDGIARGGAGRRHRHLQAVHFDAARHHRQYRPGRRDHPAGRRACATRATIPIWWSPPTRAPPPSPTSPTRISVEHDYWLGDAFASGGSAGYDHKAMGITARGAWESVKRHFREMDVNIHETPFTVVGVGDMSGDVFGNGMLRERTIKLLAAFDHRDIFIDPDPDPEKSFAERQRLFAASALELAGLRQVADLARRRRLSAQIQGNPPQPGGAETVRRRRKHDAAGTDEGDPEGAGRSVVLRRHRHLCAGRARN